MQTKIKYKSVMTGKWEYWDEKGNLIKRVKWKKGKLIR